MHELKYLSTASSSSCGLLVAPITKMRSSPEDCTFFPPESKIQIESEKETSHYNKIYIVVIGNKPFAHHHVVAMQKPLLF